MDLIKKKCVPCEGFTKPLTIEEEDKFLVEINSWKVNRENIHKIKKEFNLPNFIDAISFVNKIAEVAEDEGHHSNILIYYNKVIIEIYTHAINGLSENDFILASKIDRIYGLEFKIG